MPKIKKKANRKQKKKKIKPIIKKKKVMRTTTTKKPVKKTKTKSKKSKTQKTKKEITHKLTYKPRKAIKDIVRSNGQQRLGDNKRNGTTEYTFKPDGKSDKTPNRIKDIGRANLRTQLVHLKSTKLQELPQINTPDTAADILGGLSKNDREVVRVLYLNNKNKVIGIETAHIGSVNASIASPHEIMKTALLTNASAIIFAHNHPSGDPTPSEEDIHITKRLKEAGKTVDVEVTDSIVMGKGKYYSMRQEGMCK